MLNWLKSILGVSSTAKAETPVVEAPKVEQAKTVAKPKKQAKKPATKKTATKKAAATTDLNAMTKKELLEVAKVHGIKANASLSKSELVERVKNG